MRLQDPHGGPRPIRARVLLVFQHAKVNIRGNSVEEPMGGISFSCPTEWRADAFRSGIQHIREMFAARVIRMQDFVVGESDSLQLTEPVAAPRATAN
jgi:hypothetical protein